MSGGDKADYKCWLRLLRERGLASEIPPSSGTRVVKVKSQPPVGDAQLAFGSSAHWGMGQKNSCKGVVDHGNRNFRE